VSPLKFALGASLLARAHENYLTNIRNVVWTYVRFVFKAISPSRQNFDSVIRTNLDIDTQLSKE